MKYENKNIEAGTEKTIFKEKEANLTDNIKTLEKKNQLHEDRVSFVFWSLNTSVFLPDKENRERETWNRKPKECIKN